MNHPCAAQVSQRALFDDGARTLAAVVAALGLRAHRALPKALRSYESLAPGREAFAVRPNATYAGHRHRVDGALRADLDALFAGPNAALADVLADDVQAAIGFAADAAWLPERRRPNLEGGELR